MNRDFKIDFIGVGMPKSGSAWIVKFLRQHPEIYFPKKKEVNFFNEGSSIVEIMGSKGKIISNFSKGIDWYKKFFEGSKGKTRGEFSVSYLTDSKAPKRIRRQFPNVKILIILRNPVGFIYSLFWWMKSSIWTSEETRSLEFNDFIKQKHNYLKLGCYEMHLKNYLKHFPAENIHVILLDEIKENPLEAIKEIYKFLEVDQNFTPSNEVFQKTNTSRKVRFGFVQNFTSFFIGSLGKLHLKKLLNLIESPFLVNLYKKINTTREVYTSIKKRDSEYLKRFYGPSLTRLENLINKDLSSWRR